METKKKLFCIILLAALVLPMILIDIPNTSAATYTSYPFIGAVPNPVGVGQQVLLHVGALTALQFAEDGWVGLTVEITKPDGTKTTLSCPNTDSTGGTGIIWVPDAPGNYTLKTIFPQQNATSHLKPTNNLYKAAESDPLLVVVQTELVTYYPPFQQPTEYWSRPVDAQIREWYTIMGHWLRAPEGFYAPFNDAPSTAHILWQRPLGEDQGGLLGGLPLTDERYGGEGTDSFENGDAYEGRWQYQYIMGGILYYCPFESGIPDQPMTAIDLHTGKELWTKVFMNNARPSFFQIIDWKCLNNDGAFAYIAFQSSAGSGNTVWSFYNAYSGNWAYNMTNVPSINAQAPSIGAQVQVYDPTQGGVLKYNIVNNGTGTRTWFLNQWNQTYVISGGKTGMQGSWGSQVRGVIYNTTTRPDHGYDHNFTIPELTGATAPSILKVFPGNRIIGGSVVVTDQVQRVHLWALNLNPAKGAIGTLLFNTTWTPPRAWLEGNITVSGFSGGWCAWGEKDNVAVLFGKENRVHYGFSLETGQFLWETAPEHYLNAWDDSLSVARMIANGKFYSTSISGIINCYDVKTGETLWSYAVEDPYSEEQFSNNWWMRPMFITDDYAYFGHLEHSANNPRPRGAPFLCLNATSGEVVWRIDGAFRQSRWGGRAILGDSIIATQDTYNQQVYAIGKGPSKTTVSAPNAGIMQGSSLIISGTVTDVSPGTEDYVLTARFPNGVPAMSDASQSDWMLYVYKQFEKPADAKGVDVYLYALDSNGNYRDIGTATTDSNGVYSYQWTPDVPGKYTVYATFGGSGAYYGSTASTAFGVDAAPTATPAPTPEPLNAADMYLLPGIAGIIVSIFIVGAILALLVVRKRP